MIKKETIDWKLEEPTPISDQSVIASNHYTRFNPPAVIKIDPVLQEQNLEQLARTEKLK